MNISLRFNSLYVFTLLAVFSQGLLASSPAEQCEQLAGDEATISQAIKACTQAASNGDVASQSKLGELFDQQGNAEQAEKWWRQASNAGYQEARHLLAQKYYYGGSVFGPEPGWSQDYQRALDIWLEDARQGAAASQFMVGVMYHEGQGVEVDLVESWFWLQLALGNGYKLATDVLIEVGRKITPQQKQAAMRKLASYRRQDSGA